MNAEGVYYTGWTRRLGFQEIEQIVARRSASAISLIFRLKTRQPPFWQGSLLRLPVKTVSIVLSNLECKQVTTAETVFRYLTRQDEPAAPAARPVKTG